MSDSSLKIIPMRFHSFSDIDRLHRFADHLFIEHQAACMEHNWDIALRKLELMYELRIQNIKVENEFLLPLYKSEISEIPKGGALKYFEREHKLIAKYLKSIIHNISDIVLHELSDKINLVKLFENYKDVKDLLDHHDAREREFLFKLLDENIDIQTKSSILEKINNRQAVLIENFEIGHGAN
jgi:hypothetical protein